MGRTSDLTLLNEAFQTTLQVTKKHGYPMNLCQLFQILDEVYDYALDKTPSKVDMDFVEWFVKRTVG